MANEIKDKAIASVKAQLSDKAKAFLTTAYGDLNEYISSQIEAYIYQTK